MTNDVGADREEVALDPETSQALDSAGAAAHEGSDVVTVGHVADYNHRYPGEFVTFYTRVNVHEPVSDLVLRIAIPEGLELVEYHPPASRADSAPQVQVDEGTHHLVWNLDGALGSGDRYEYQTEARVGPVSWNSVIECRALVTNGQRALLADESIHLALWAKGRYLRYLPELYERDELMGRLLMLFESFWAPIETQIGSAPYYLEPKMTPTNFLAWLAGWLGLDLDERLSEDRQRLLIGSAIWLYRQRGTKQALKQYLEIYTGTEVKIVEHRASDFRVGVAGRLGHGIAFGKGNHPHTFTVILRLPPEKSRQDSRSEARYRRMIEGIINAEKPAHTNYTLIIEREA